MWIVVLILGIIFVPIGGIIAGSGDKTGLILVGLGVVLVAVAVVNRNRIKRQKAAREEANKAYMIDQDLQTIQAGGLPSVSGVPVVLADGEVAHYFAPARRYITKTKAIGRTGSGGGVRVRVAKGVSVAAGGGASQTVYDDVTDSFPGQIVLTNRRIVFLAQQNGFDCKLDAISAITPEGDRIMIQAGTKNYRLLVAQQGHFAKILDKVTG